MELTHKELRDRFNPEGSDLRKLQLRLLEILDEIDRLCKENNITYWLTAGNLLGAIRNGGFIPWDDDLDVCMLKEDYEKFLKIAPTKLNPKYVLNNKEPVYTSTYLKVVDTKSKLERKDAGFWKYLDYQGLYVDVFSMENSATLISFISGKLMYYGVDKWATKRFTSKFLKRITDFNYKLITKLAFPILRAFKFLANKDTMSFSLGIGCVREQRRFSHVFPLGECEFEGKKYPCPANCDAYLKSIYGDYKTVPSLDKIRVHSDKVEFLD